MDHMLPSPGFSIPTPLAHAGEEEMILPSAQQQQQQQSVQQQSAQQQQQQQQQQQHGFSAVTPHSLMQPQTPNMMSPAVGSQGSVGMFGPLTGPGTPLSGPATPMTPADSSIVPQLQ